METRRRNTGGEDEFDGGKILRGMCCGYRLRETQFDDQMIESRRRKSIRRPGRIAWRLKKKWQTIGGSGRSWRI